ncbi:MAG: HAD family hydrolase [Ignavibacteriae bacterium]|nr:HAD family hydrolase [Ignavibacteriota bacterium]NOG97913.1 HAD family hydrolase [Ignavibacteriota bacterium]
MNSEIKNIIFDYGGTLDTHGIHWSEKFWEVYKHYHIPISKHDFKKAFVDAEKSIPRVINTNFGLQQTYNTQLTYQFNYLEKNSMLSSFYFVLVEQLKNYCYKKILQNIEVSKLILSLLEHDYQLGLVSNYYGNVKTVLEEIALKKYFNAIIDSTVVGFRKPDIKIFELALNELSAKPEETIVVGDSYENDIAPAKKIGCYTIWLNGKSWKTPTEVSSADVIINSMKQLPDVLK